MSPGRIETFGHERANLEAVQKFTYSSSIHHAASDDSLLYNDQSICSRSFDPPLCVGRFSCSQRSIHLFTFDPPLCVGRFTCSSVDLLLQVRSTIRVGRLSGSTTLQVYNSMFVVLLQNCLNFHSQTQLLLSRMNCLLSIRV